MSSKIKYRKVRREIVRNVFLKDKNMEYRRTTGSLTKFVRGVFPAVVLISLSTIKQRYRKLKILKILKFTGQTRFLNVI